ncbi:DUF6123 family protein [Bacillus timonensis]|nr:DUF6123 family protein [Bacillus timonensis]
MINSRSRNSVQDYLLFLEEKGFYFGEDVHGFIFFGQNYTNSTDEIVNCAIETTLKVQKKFDGSYFVSLLEMFKENNISNRHSAFQMLKQKKILTLE